MSLEIRPRISPSNDKTNAEPEFRILNEVEWSDCIEKIKKYERRDTNNPKVAFKINEYRRRVAESELQKSRIQLKEKDAELQAERSIRESIESSWAELNNDNIFLGNELSSVRAAQKEREEDFKWLKVDLATEKNLSNNLSKKIEEGYKSYSKLKRRYEEKSDQCVESERQLEKIEEKYKDILKSRDYEINKLKTENCEISSLFKKLKDESSRAQLLEKKVQEDQEKINALQKKLNEEREKEEKHMETQKNLESVRNELIATKKRNSEIMEQNDMLTKRYKSIECKITAAKIILKEEIKDQ